METNYKTRAFLALTAITGSLIVANQIYKAKAGEKNQTPEQYRAPSGILPLSQEQYATPTVQEPIFLQPQEETLEEKIKAPQTISYKTTNIRNDDDDETLLARMLFGEARGESTFEMTCIAYTAMNRVNDGVKWNGTTLRNVLLTADKNGYHAYSCFNNKPANAKNYAALLDPERSDPQNWARARWVAQQVIAGTVPDPTQGATEYHTLAVSPKWKNEFNAIGQLRSPDGKYTAHTFYKRK